MTSHDQNTLATKEAAPLLEINNLCVSYFTRKGEIPAVIDFSLQLLPGDSIGLVGESGCGKSTVAMAIMNYLGHSGKITGGTIKFKGQDVAAMDARQLQALRGGDIAMVYQEPMAALNPSMSIGQQLAEVPIEHEAVSSTEAWERAADLLKKVRIPDPARILNSYAHQLSGGQQQRVIIAMALLSNPALLLLDEPTTALDVTVEAGIVDLIEEIRETFGTALIYISHNLGLIRDVADRVNVMYSGEVVEQGRVAEVFANPRHPYTQGLFDCIPLPLTDRFSKPLRPIRGQLPLPNKRPLGCNFGPRCDFFREQDCNRLRIPLREVSEDSTAKVRCVLWETNSPSEEKVNKVRDDLDIGEAILDVRDVRKYYALKESAFGTWLSSEAPKQVKANDDLNFSVRRGETVAIVGESGCGKSTFAKVLLGLETATSGEVVFDGDEIGSQPVIERDDEQISRIQMVFQNPSDTLNPSHTVGSQIGRAISKFSVETNKKKIRERVHDLLELVKLPRNFYDRKPRQLSGGQKQRIGIARAFAGNPDMVVADEPVSALDVSVAAAVTELLLDLQQKQQTTLLFISHDLSVVRYLANKVVVMYLGQIMEAGPTDAVFSPPYHPYTEALLSAVPLADPSIEKREVLLEGTVPSPSKPPLGCPFHTRCPRKLGSICETEKPLMQNCGKHRIACHIPIVDLKKVKPIFEFTSS